MDTKYLTKLVMDKFIEGEYYTEVPIKDLKDRIEKYLDEYYVAQVKIGLHKIEIQKSRGEDVNELNYRNSYARAKEKTIKQAYAVGAVDQSDLKDLKEMNKL